MGTRLSRFPARWPASFVSALAACSGGTMGTGDGMQTSPPDLLSMQSPQYTVETVDQAASGAGTALIYDASGKAQLLYFGEGSTMNCNLMGTTSTYHPSNL